ncbi:hypothetical protein ACFRMN_38505 [Streptomyces sp. NPDC056835]|uniref:hypothetical protein n=1 Tax=Streptomyces sp. NPDC056835 TaxID=3345956 RepID=UPI003673CAA3
MRDCISRALLWVLRMMLPARGRHAAVPVTAPAPAPVSPWSEPWTGVSAKETRAIFHAEETRSLTPEQRERWWAAAFSEIGVDYDFPTMNITDVRNARHEAAA